jgi:molybdopterin converting factor small subunit
VRVTVRYFGIISDRTGKREETVSIEPETTLAALRARVLGQYKIGPETAAHTSVNGKGVAPPSFSEYRLQNGDVVVFLPPMSGG